MERKQAELSSLSGDHGFQVLDHRLCRPGVDAQVQAVAKHLGIFHIIVLPRQVAQQREWLSVHFENASI